MSYSEESHVLVSALKDLASELGRTPTRQEFYDRVRNAERRVNRAFSNYTAMLKAAGLEPSQNQNPKKIDSSIFERDIERHLEQYRPKPHTERGPYPTAAIISDIHWPFESARVIAKFLTYVEKHKPQWVIINGDAWDFFSHSKYPRSHNIFTPREEQALARKKNEEFWRDVRRVSPGSTCYQLLGNHDIRPMKRILESYPEAEDWISEKLKQLFTFEGVRSIHDPREELFIAEDILVFHGYRTQLGSHRDHTLYSCFNGHSHVGGVVYRKIRGSVLFECNSGVAGDPESKGLSYTSQRIEKWTPGFAVINEYGPQFIPC